MADAGDYPSIESMYEEIIKFQYIVGKHEEKTNEYMNYMDKRQDQLSLLQENLARYEVVLNEQEQLLDSSIAKLNSLRCLVSVAKDSFHNEPDWEVLEAHLDKGHEMLIDGTLKLEKYKKQYYDSSKRVAQMKLEKVEAEESFNKMMNILKNEKNLLACLTEVYEKIVEREMEECNVKEELEMEEIMPPIDLPTDNAWLCADPEDL